MEILPNISPEEERLIDKYVREISEDFFGKPYFPEITPKCGVLPNGVGGTTESSCSLYGGCKPEEIVLNRYEQTLLEYRKLVPLLHEKTHEAQIKAFPYLPLIADEKLVEGMVIYADIKKLLETGNYLFAKVYYDSLSLEYKQYYQWMKELEQNGTSIKELAKTINEIGKLCSKFIVSESERRYN